jgi:cytochrome b involved in lipid metabolism
MQAPTPAAKPELSRRQRWIIRDSWKLVEPLVCPKGFGSLALMKEQVGMPKAVRSDHHDWDETNTQQDALDEAYFDTISKQLLDSSHILTITFYRHLFKTNPQMKEIFWRFNLYQTLEKIVNVLHPDLDLDASLRALGERHRGRGIVNSDYDRIGISIEYALNELASHEHFSKDMIEAWVTGYNVFANAMKVPEVPIPQTTSSSDQATSSTSTPLPTYTLDEVARHAQENDLWLVIEGNVYDLTKFYPDHPGGEMMMLGAGRDATELFVDNFHSDRARAILAQYIIGKLASS